MATRRSIVIGRVAVVAAGVLLLEWLARGGAVSQLILTAPSAIAVRIGADILSGELLGYLKVTAFEFVVAFLIATVLGVATGALFFRFRYMGAAVEPLLLAFYAAPTILLYPVFLSLFGLGSMVVISMAVIFGTIPVMVNVTTGLSGVDAIYRKLGRSLRASSWQLFWKIMLPAATPTIFSGIRIGFTYTLTGVIAMEFLLFSGGLGRMVSWRYSIFDTDGVYAAVVTVIVVALTANGLVRMAEDRVRTRLI